MNQTNVDAVISMQSLGLLSYLKMNYKVEDLSFQLHLLIISKRFVFHQEAVSLT